MSINFEFSIIMAIYNTEQYLNEAIDSVINQTLNFQDSTQLILVDDGSTDNSKEICLDYQKEYPNNIIVLSKENGGQSSARNLGLEYASGKYINFLDSDDKLSKNALKNVSDYFADNDVYVVALPLIFFGKIEREHFLNDKFIKEKNINVYDQFEYPQLHISSCFIKKEALKNLKFDERLNIGEDAVLINKILSIYKKIGFINSSKYFYRKRFDFTSTLNSIDYKKEFYLDKTEYFHKELIEYSLSKFNKVPEFIQYVIVYDLRWYYNRKPIEKILSKEEYDIFMNNLSYILNNIDEKSIRNHNYLKPNLKSFLIFLRNREFHVVAKPERNEVLLKTNNRLINRLHNHKIDIDHIGITENDVLNISGLFVSNCDNDAISIFANLKNNGHVETFKGKYIDYSTNRTTEQSLGINWKFNYSFDLKIPINDANCEIALKVKYHENDNEVIFSPKIRFKKYCSLSDLSNFSLQNSFILTFENNKFYIKDYTAGNLLKLESQSTYNILTSSEKHKLYSIFIRIIYYSLFMFYKNKRIWIFMDRIIDADDNSEHLFEYAIQQDDKIEKYYVIDKNSTDYKRLKEDYKNIIENNSLKHRILFLFKEKLITSHPEYFNINPFFEKNIKLYNGLSKNESYFLQHGVTKDNISSWLHKFDKNLKLIVTTSDLENESFLEPGYNYDKEIINTLGFPRFDKLNSENTKKQIIIMHSWRQNLTDENLVSHSEYLEKLRSLLNNEKLIKNAKKYNYEITFKPHPKFKGFIHLLSLNDYVKISENERYREIFNKSSLMVTDYSSVFFDFGFLKKPIIYYQYNNEDYHFDVEKSYFNYETMGFGEVIDNEDDLINLIIDYMKNNCEMKEKYKKRVDNFFRYNDKNNCKRVYDWIYEH